MKCTHLLGQHFVKGVSSKGYIFTDIMDQHATGANLVNMLALDFEVVDPGGRWARLDGDDGGDFLQPRADALALPQLACLNELLPVLAPEG